MLLSAYHRSGPKLIFFRNGLCDTSLYEIHQHLSRNMKREWRINGFYEQFIQEGY